VGGFKAILIFSKFMGLGAFLDYHGIIIDNARGYELIPIPALDGGHVMFLLYEIISGKNQEVTNS
jgi:regulator of sigma E protease